MELFQDETVQRFSTACFHFISDCLYAGLVFHECMATEFCVPNPDQRADIPDGGIIAVFIALVTISFQTIRVALASPVNNLRAE